MRISTQPMRRIGRAIVVLACIGSCFIAPGRTRADAVGEKKRSLLAHVHRIVVVPPFFGTETLRKAARDPDDAAAPHDDNSRTQARLAQYAEQLRRLESHARERLPARLEARTDFDVVSSEELNAALKALDTTPQKLFLNNGLVKGSKFALPDAAAVHALADRLHADAVLLETMDEPRRNNGRYYFDPLAGINYDSPKVASKAAFFLLQPDGTEILHDYIEVLHPLSKLGSREFLLADWEETGDEVIEDFMDELTRYTPAPKAHRATPPTNK